MSKVIPKSYICGVIDGSGRVWRTQGHIYRFRKSCQNYCDRLNQKQPEFIYHVLVANDWRLAGDSDAHI